MIIKISAFSLVVLLAIIVLRQANSVYALILSLVSCIFIFYLIFPNLETVFTQFKNISENLNINSKYTEIIFKIIGISYICEFASQICADAGVNSLATKIELSGKILIMTCSIPILNDILELILNLT